MQLLKRQQAKPSTVIDDFFYAARKGDLGEVKRLLHEFNELGDDYHINVKNSVGKTALIIAADHGRENVVRYLCENGANTALQDMGAYTALMYAQNYNQKIDNRREIVEKLMEHSCK